MTESLPLEPVVEQLVRAAGGVNARIMLVGAAARDMALAHEGQDAARRATEDIDFAVAVSGFDTFEAMTSRLEPVPGTEHKFRVLGVEVDVVPFGAIESPERTITWPNGTVMNTLGLAEAFEGSLEIELDGGSSIRVATLPAQAALKLFAWADRASWTRRDGADLGTIIEAYSLRDRLDTVFEPSNEALLVRYDYEVAFVGAHLLGVDVLARMGSEVADAAGGVLDADLGGLTLLPAALRLEYPQPQALLEAFRTGLARS